MHELALGQAIVDTIGRRSDGREVRRVAVRIGHFRQVVPDSLQFAWEMITEGTNLAGCRLDIDHVPAVIACRSCDARTTLDLPILMCEACASLDVELVSGEEFMIATIDVAASEPTMPKPTMPMPKPTMPMPKPTMPMPKPTMEVSFGAIPPS